MKTPVPLSVHANDLNHIDAAATASGMSREDVLIVGGLRFAKALTATNEGMASTTAGSDGERYSGAADGGAR